MTRMSCSAQWVGVAPTAARVAPRRRRPTAQRTSSSSAVLHWTALDWTALKEAEEGAKSSRIEREDSCTSLQAAQLELRRGESSRGAPLEIRYTRERDARITAIGCSKR